MDYYMYVDNDSMHLREELYNYTWATDKNDKPLDKPIDKWNHLIDSIRYVQTTYSNQKSSEIDLVVI